MKNGKCPMCNSTAVYTNSHALLRASGNSLQLIEPYSELNTYLTPYVCVQCGFVAMFVEAIDQLKDLPDGKGWEQVK